VNLKKNMLRRVFSKIRKVLLPLWSSPGIPPCTWIGRAERAISAAADA